MSIEKSDVANNNQKLIAKKLKEEAVARALRENLLRRKKWISQKKEVESMRSQSKKKYEDIASTSTRYECDDGDGIVS